MLFVQIPEAHETTTESQAVMLQIVREKLSGTPQHFLITVTELSRLVGGISLQLGFPTRTSESRH